MEATASDMAVSSRPWSTFEATKTSWDSSKETIKGAVDALFKEIDQEIAYVFLANDKGNKHGFGTIERMRDYAKMEELVPKATLDLYAKAHSSMNSFEVV